VAGHARSQTHNSFKGLQYRVPKQLEVNVMRFADLRGLAVMSAMSATAILTACGGGDPAQEPSHAVVPAATGRVHALDVSDSQRIAAATATANSSTNACSTARPFYWEIGNAAGPLVSGSVMNAASSVKFAGSTQISVASASKWLYAAYVVQLRNGQLNATDIKHLTLRSGYVSFQACLQTESVDSCLADQTNGAYSAAYDGVFDYNGGHFQKHASLIGLGADTVKPLAVALQTQLGADVPLVYSQPQLAGGLYITPDTYGSVLRKMLGGQLVLGGMLGSNAVCTNPATCPGSAAAGGPIPPNLNWHYSLGHWVEDDPISGDGAFSSPGSMGFYPWIDATKTSYGMVARSVVKGAFNSASCGQTIRRAWATGNSL
jgi:hypothetical protein